MIFQESFDARPNFLKIKIGKDWPEERKETIRDAQESILKDFLLEYGSLNREQKLQNFRDIGAEPMSVISYHHTFFRECKSSFIMGAYYPALMGTCALGERILNHLILNLREYYKSSEIYKRVYNKDSFDNWDLAIDALVEWGVLLEGVPQLLQQLQKIRNASIHFDVNLENGCRSPALNALHLVQRIIEEQFGSRPGGNRNWFIEDAPGFSIIKKECEDIPFIREFYLPSSVLLGPFYRFEYQENNSMQIFDREPYEKKEISDEEFIRLLQEYQASGEYRRAS